MFIGHQKMKHQDIFARSFAKHDQKRFGYGALFSCCVVTWCLCTVFKSYFGPLYHLNLRLMMVDELKLAIVTDTRSSIERPYVETKEREPICNTSGKRSDTCEMKGDVRIYGTSSTIFVSTSNDISSSWTVKPYARKSDTRAMEGITNFTIKAIQKKDRTVPKCTKTHSIPAIVFSASGYSGNTFHAFSDIIIPLYAASRKFNGEVRFLVTNKNSPWIRKFQEVLNKLSRYEIIYIDYENEVHCFPHMIVGLKRDDRKELNIDSMKDFTEFLRRSYSLERSTAIKSSTKKPRLLIVSRQKTRAFTNVKDVANAARHMGFEVIVTEMNANLTQISKLVNSCDVMMGVHGAGLTNMVFQPENSVFIQVVPWGKMEWMAKTFYGEPSKGMGLKYLEYSISKEESSLIEQYPLNHSVFVDPYSVQRNGWGAYKSIYMKQNIKLDLVRFKHILSEALQLLD